MPVITLVTVLVGISSLSITPTAKYTLEQNYGTARIGLSALQPGIFRVENHGDQVTYSNALDDDNQTILDVFIQRQLADGKRMTVWLVAGGAVRPVLTADKR